MIPVRAICAAVFPLAAAVAASLAAGGQRASARPAQERPVFQAGVDLVPLDVVVLDGDRRPVKGLVADDFTITENGVAQTIQTFEAIDVPAPDVDEPAWTREIAPDVVSNEIQARRLVLLLLDDGSMGVDRGEPSSLRMIAERVIDGLGPTDLAAVVYTYQGRVENFTTDREKLRKAVDAFVPNGWGSGGPPIACRIKPGGCAVDAVGRVAAVLGDAPAGRKLLVFISPGARLGAGIAENPDEFTGLDAVRIMFANLQRANVSVYSYDPRGLMPTSLATNEIALAEATGGRRVQGTNTPETHVAQMLRESSAYYLIGYRTTTPGNERRFRRIRVTVNRRGVDVRTRNGYFAVRPGENPILRRPASELVDQAIERGFPVNDLPVRATTAAFAGRDGKTAELVSVLTLREPARSALPADRQRRVEVVAAAFDMNGRPKGGRRQTIGLTLGAVSAADAEYEVTSRLPLAPGRYEIRMAAVVDGRAGSVFTTVEIPDFTRAPLSLSGLVVERRPPLPSSTALLGELLPVAPTAVRTFASSDRASVFFRLYQGGNRPLAPVQLTIRVTDLQNIVVHTDASELTAAGFHSGRTADFRWTIPVSRFGPGAHLLTIEAALGGARIIRHLRFRIP